MPTDKQNKSTPPDIVLEAIKKAFPTHADDIIKELKYDSLCDFWHFNRWGTFIGVERDGYIHS